MPPLKGAARAREKAKGKYKDAKWTLKQNGDEYTLSVGSTMVVQLKHVAAIEDKDATGAASQAQPQEINAKTKQYVVRNGDTLGKIAKAHKVSLIELIKANSQFNISKLKNWRGGPGKEDRIGKKARNPNWIYPGEPSFWSQKSCDEKLIVLTLCLRMTFRGPRRPTWLLVAKDRR